MGFIFGILELENREIYVIPIQVCSKSLKKKKSTSGNNLQIHTVSQVSDRPFNPYLYSIFIALFTGHNQHNA